MRIRHADARDRRACRTRTVVWWRFGWGLQTLSGGLRGLQQRRVECGVPRRNVDGDRAYQDFNLTANYTYSHTIDNGNFTTFINLPAEPVRLHSERANSNQDARHRLVTNFTATGPEDTFVGTSRSAASSPCNPGDPSRSSGGQRLGRRRWWRNGSRRRRARNRPLRHYGHLRDPDRKEYVCR